MSHRHTDPPEHPNSGGGDTPPTGDIYDDNALRQAIARLAVDDIDSTLLDDTDKQARLAELRRQILEGEYLSQERIGDIVDRLLRKWKI